MIKTTVADFGRGAARFHCIDSSGPNLHFAHANGLPFPTYRTFLKLFADSYSVCGIDNRGAWPDQPEPEPGYNWLEHATDVITFFEHHYDQPVIAVGHSIGGTVSLFAAMQRPELFKALILIDAATSPHRLADWILRLTPKFVSRRISIIKRTRERRRNWESRQQFIDHHKTRRAYKDFTDAAFDDYAEGGLEATDEGNYKLVFNPAWEAFNFQTTPYIWDALSKITVPTLMLSAEHTYLHDHSVLLRHAKHFSPAVEYEVLQGLHHLAPQQDPHAVALKINNWLSSIGLNHGG